jgi:hypothetical protein
MTFYYDPTHRHPLPPELLSFLTEYYGFKRVKVVRLQEWRGLSTSQSTSLDQVLGGASPDYAVIAQKAADGSVARLFDNAFNKEFGLDAHVLVGRFDRQLIAQNERVAALEVRFDEEHTARVALAARFDHERTAYRVLEARFDEGRSAHAALEARLDEESAARAALAADLLAKNEALAALYASTSWLITAPLRSTRGAARWFVGGTWAWVTVKPGSRPRRVAARCVVGAVRFCRARPTLTNMVRRTLRWLPTVEAQLRRIVVFDVLGPGATPTTAVDDVLLCEPSDVRIAYQRLRAAKTNAGDTSPRAVRDHVRSRLAYVSPLPPERTGVADYSAELLPALSSYYDIDAIVAPDPRSIPPTIGLPAFAGAGARKCGRCGRPYAASRLGGIGASVHRM